MNDTSNSRNLIHTEQGRKWLSQFALLDQKVAISIVDKLTLVSHTEFERNLISKLGEVASGIKGSVGFFAIRELEKEQGDIWLGGVAIPFYSQVTSQDGGSVNALSPSSDQGSEARVVHIIRQLCRQNPKKYLNHPTLESLRKSKADAIIFVDDFIGSGRRVRDFLDSFWLVRTVVSWLSGKQIEFHVVAYSGIEDGINHAEKHKSKPQVHIYRDAPTFDSFPWSNDKKESVKELCRKYGSVANRSRQHMWYGYKEGMAAIVFEHGCPNNVPAILWEKGSAWEGIFPNRTIPLTVASAFSPEIVQKDLAQILQEVGQYRLALSIPLHSLGPDGQTILVVLGLIAKGQRKRSTLSFSTGLNVEDCERLIEKCMGLGLITVQRRITSEGLAELNAARKLKIEQSPSLDRGTDYYYPKQLREAAHD